MKRMKGEHVKEEKGHPSSMFAQLQQAQIFQNRPPSTSALNPPPSFQIPTTAANQCQASEEDSSGAAKLDLPTQTLHLLPPPPPPGASSGNDGATIEVVRRPRGRPPGSKNKPKPPVIITREAEPSMSPYVLELPGGVDVVETLVSFSRKRNIGLSILSGSGTVINVTLRQPSTNPGGSVTFHGRFDILSLSATILAGNPGFMSSEGSIASGFTISLAGPQGQVVGGAVVGPLYSAGTVFLIAATFNNPMFHKLPLEDDQRNSGSPGSGGNEVSHQQSPVSGGESAVSAACGGVGGLYNMGSDVMWAPTARQPPQHPPPY